MRSTLSIAGILLLVVGILTLAYQGVTYTKREKIAEIGSLKVTSDTQKTIYFPPILGGLSIVAGVALLVIGRNKNL